MNQQKPQITVTHVIARWTESVPMDPRKISLARVQKRLPRPDEIAVVGAHEVLLGLTDNLGNRHLFSCAVIPRGQPVFADPAKTTILAWALLRLGPGVWTVLPSLEAVDALHVFLTIMDVPEPPPWESEAAPIETVSEEPTRPETPSSVETAASGSVPHTSGEKTA